MPGEFLCPLTKPPRGMGISASDWQRFRVHLQSTRAPFQLSKKKTADVLTFIESTKSEIVE